MRWDAIVKFADRGASNFNDYPPLPPHPVIGDADKPVEYRGTVYKRTEPEDWIQYLGDDLKEGLGKLPRKVVPVPFEGDDDLATVNITDEDLEKLKDKKTGTIRFEKVFHWCLARFPKDTTSTEEDWQATGHDHYEQFLRDPDRGNGTRTKRRFRTSTTTTIEKSLEDVEESSTTTSTVGRTTRTDTATATSTTKTTTNTISKSVTNTSVDTNIDMISLYSWQAQRMSNYLHYAIKKLGFKPKWYDPFNVDPKNVRDVEWYHVQRFYGAMMCRNLKGNPSIDNMYSTRNSFHHIHAICESMTQDQFRDLHRLIHFVDDFGDDVVDQNGKVVSTPPSPLDDGEDWSDLYKYNRVVADEGTTKHRKKFSLLEQAYCKRWRECINMGKWICMDKSRVK